VNFFLMGLLIPVGIALIAYRAHALNLSGTIAVVLLGTVVFGLGGVDWALIMLTFFFSSSRLSKLFAVRKESPGSNISRGSQRDTWQVAANWGMAGFLLLRYVILSRFSPESTFSPFLWIGFAGSLATANADTWATELGLLNPSEPLLITVHCERFPKGLPVQSTWSGPWHPWAGVALIGGWLY